MLLTATSQLSKALVAGNALFVDGLAGSDITGQRGRADLPFASIYAANKASQWGDIIYILFGTGYYGNDSPDIACMAGRFYYVDPGVILTSRLLNAPYEFIASLSGTGGLNDAFSSSNSFAGWETGREVVITWGSNPPQRYLVGAVMGSSTLVLADSIPGSGAVSGYGYLVPGPMQADPFRNGQSDGLAQFQRFADPSTLTLVGSSITATSAKLLADVSTEFAPGQLTDGPTANDPTLVGNYAQTGSNPSGLYAGIGSFSNLNPLGRCALVTTGFGTTASGTASYICGENDSGGATCYIDMTSTAMSALWGGGSGISITRNAWFGLALALNNSSSGDWYLWEAGVRTSGTQSGANTMAFAGNNYLIGGTHTSGTTRIGGYAFFDGPASFVKKTTMLNAFLNDLGLY